jgi:rhodanese-related sulfurtransferase/signal-transduction protein with cAMP-binding, CBS, and nucleotidyltransferase domain
MKSIKLDKVVQNLTRNYMPFNLLSAERVTEVTNIVRFIEMRKGEIFQIRGGDSNDYLFVIEGSVEVIQTGAIKSIVGPNETRKRPVVLPATPNTSTLVATADTIICHADREMLDKLIAWDEVVHMAEDRDHELYARMEKIRNSLVFRRLPLECVEMAFQRMKEIVVPSGQEVIRQGDDGDAFFIIIAGRAEVWQRGVYDDAQHKMAELTEGDAFGCEALISGHCRSETVRIIEEATLLVLDKSDFEWLISKQLIKTVNHKIARTMLESGYKIIDVRYPEEYDEYHVPGAILMPLFELRDRMKELDPDQRYIVYCHGGGRSAVACMKLSQNNFDVLSLEGGIRDWPFETESVYPKEVVQVATTAPVAEQTVLKAVG